MTKMDEDNDEIYQLFSKWTFELMIKWSSILSTISIEGKHLEIGVWTKMSICWRMIEYSIGGTGTKSS